MYLQPSLSTIAGAFHEVAVRCNPPLGALPPNPRDFSRSGQNESRRRLAPPPAIPAAESALGLRPRSALSSAQVPSEWTLSTLPCNDFSANGDNPLNFVSHSRGSVQSPFSCIGGDAGPHPTYWTVVELRGTPFRVRSAALLLPDAAVFRQDQPRTLWFRASRYWRAV